MGARFEPLTAVAAALVGAIVVVAVVGGPLWLLVPGLLGAGLPLLFERVRTGRLRS
jgi:hypothetical protein